MGAVLVSSYDIPSGPFVDADGNLLTAWAVFLNRTHNNARTLQESGTTADRPTSLLWIGRFFFDTTLGKPIWVKSVPAKPAAAVWCDATGASV